MFNLGHIAFALQIIFRHPYWQRHEMKEAAN
jgi:hypothetical protein